MADGGSLGQMSYKDASQCPGYGQDSTLARPATFLRTSKATPRMFFAKRQSQFSPDSVYIVVVKKHDEYNPSIGFFHHKKRETGFLAYAQSASDIRTVKVQQRLTEDFAIFDFAKLADFSYSQKYSSVYCPTQAGSLVIEWDDWLCDVLLRLDRQRKEGKLIWRHKCDDIKVLGQLRVVAPKGFVLLTSLSVFTQP